MRIDKRKLDLELARRSMTVGELRKRSGVPPATITRIINGTRKGRPVTIGRIAAALDIDPKELLVDSEEN